MQPTLCSRCKKNVAVIFITRLEGGQTKNEGLCLKCARELDVYKRQVYSRGTPFEKAAIRGVSTEIYPVSYTHLDVYKRQAQE